MLLFEHVVGKRKLAWRSVVGLVLYINFLLARATQIPKLEVRKAVEGVVRCADELSVHGRAL